MFIIAIPIPGNRSHSCSFAQGPGVVGGRWGFGYPNFGRSVLGCIEADVCKFILNTSFLQHCFFRDLQDRHVFAHLEDEFALWESGLEATKSALAEHHLGEKQSTGEKKKNEPHRGGGAGKNGGSRK